MSSERNNITDGGYTPQRYGGCHANVLWCSFCWFIKSSTCDLYPDKTTPIFLFTLACACPAAGKSQKAHFLCLLVWTEYVGEYRAIAKTHWSVSFGFFATQTQITAQNNLKHQKQCLEGLKSITLFLYLQVLLLIPFLYLFNLTAPLNHLWIYYRCRGTEISLHM